MDGSQAKMKPTGLLNRDRLRRATRDAHANAEHLWFSAGAFTDRATYLRWLTAMAHVHADIGHHAATALRTHIPERIETERAQALSQDLQKTIPGGPNRPRLSESYAWGAMYVLNGSAMGASVLLKPGVLPPQWPRHYLYAMQSFSKSGQLRRFFDQLEARNLDHADSIAGATAVFHLLQG